MKKAIVISLTLFACSVKANSLCTLNPVSAEKVVKIQGVPGWFFKVHPDGDVASFIGADSNQMLDLNSGVQKPTLGTIDPVWAPDGSHMTHPGTWSETSASGIQFFPGKEMIDASFAGKPDTVTPVNSTLGGVYQSIGKSKDGKFTMISDAGGVSMIDYEYGPNGPRNVSQPRRPCRGLNYGKTDLPMLSKDGRFLSLYDAESKSTKIFKMNNGDCSLALDLGYGSGKVSFNADSTQIAFHIDQFSDFQTGYFSGVGKDKIKNVMVMNIEETSDGKLNPTSWALASRHTRPGNGGYYPDFDKQGNIYFMEDVDNNFQFVKVNQSNLEFRPMHGDLVFGNVNCAPEATPSAPVILANMWKEVCGKDNLAGPELIMGINPADCRKMVDDFFNSNLNATKEELLAYCPQDPYEAPHSVGEWNPNQKAQAEELLKGKCLNCHRTPKTMEVTEKLTVQTGPSSYSQEDISYVKRIPPMTLQNMDYTAASDMLTAIQTGKMPKKEPLTAEQKTELMNYLQKRMLDMKPFHANDFLNVRRYSEDHLAAERQKILRQYPQLGEAQKQEMILAVNCVYGQQNCNEYIQAKMPSITAMAASKDEADREKFIADQVLGIRCMNLFEVNPQQCKDWQKRNPNQSERR